MLVRDRQGEDAVQPSLDRRQLIDQLTFIFEAKPCPVAEITESDAGEFAAMQKPVPGQKRILGIVAFEVVHRVEAILPAVLTLAPRDGAKCAEQAHDSREEPAV